jgi:hypothetical protein
MVENGPLMLPEKKVGKVGQRAGCKPLRPQVVKNLRARNVPLSAARSIGSGCAACALLRGTYGIIL